MTDTDAYTDVVELCALLQCLGFNVKSLESSDGNVSLEGGLRTIVINCQASGLHVVLESGGRTCSCPPVNQQNSSVWQVSGMTGGKQFSREYGSALLGSLPKAHRDRLTVELQEIVKCIRDNNESDCDRHKPANRSASMMEITTPDKRHLMLKTDTPTRCRSLDALITDPDIPAPGPLQKTEDPDPKKMCQRQSTYTLCTTPGNMRRRNKTSSPIQEQHNSLLESIIAAEKLAEGLRNQLSTTIRELMEDGKNESSMSSLTLDVSKISVLKGPEISKQFSSSPNLSRMGVHDDIVRKLKRTDSASTSNLATKPTPKEKEGKLAKLRKLSPNLFKKNGPGTTKTDKDKNTKLNCLSRPKIVTPVRIPKPEASPNLSASRKKFSHVKSTIPRPAAKKE